MKKDKNTKLTGVAPDDGKFEKTVDPKQLKRGIEVEYEHTNNPKLSKQIALDHLKEIPDYYTRLDKMEEKAEQKKAAAFWLGMIL